MKKENNKFIWTILSLLIAAASIWAVASQAKDVSFPTIISHLADAANPWLYAAVGGMLGFIFFEAVALRSISRAFHSPCTLRRSILYSSADIYFSAITPSATGGQPACAFLMMRDGISGVVTTLALLLNLAMYSLSILAIGLLCFTIKPGIFLYFGTTAKILIVLGFTVQIGLALSLLLLIKNEFLLARVCTWVLHLLAKLHLLRNVETKEEHLLASMERYRQSVSILAGQRKLLFQVFLWNFLQRASQISVTMFVYLAMGGNVHRAFDLWAMQSYVVLGSNCVPIPGAMGVADYLMLDSFRTILDAQQAIRLELLSRSLSFYCCILICGMSVLFHYLIQKKKGAQP
ncbi:MAG: lysylphosphatidylglycerol synthase transmembrane domain-containing protein [Oscillospiraceae bacterium]|jgi:uncharacterized protein (TIRG00374 family)